MRTLTVDQMKLMAERMTPQQTEAMRKTIHLADHMIRNHFNGTRLLTEDQVEDLQDWFSGNFGMTSGQEGFVKLKMRTAPIQAAFVQPPRFPKGEVQYADPCSPGNNVQHLKTLGPSRKAPVNTHDVAGQGTTVAGKVIAPVAVVPPGHTRAPRRMPIPLTEAFRK